MKAWIAAALMGSTLFVATRVDAGAFSGRRIALVVGINEFSDPHWTRLAYAKDDARDLAAALEPSFDRVTVIGKDAPATRQSVMDALRTLASMNVSDLDTVVIYLSTHGTLAYDDRGTLRRVLVLHDTTAAEPMRTGLVHDELVERLDALRARHKVLVLAACHAGTGKSVLTDDVRDELRGLKAPFFPEPRLPIGEGQLVLAASAWGESAREDDRLGHDIYTHFFLEALRGFDSNGDGATTALEAHDYARTRTLDYTGGRQRPTLHAQIVGEAPVVLAGRIVRHGDPVIAAYADRFTGAVLELDGRRKGALPGSFSLSPGSHHVRVRRPGASTPMVDMTVNLEPGAVLVLDRPDRGGTPLRIDAGLAWALVRGDVERSYWPSHVLVHADLSLTIAPKWRAGVTVAYSHASGALTAPRAEGTQRVSLGRAGGLLTFAALELEHLWVEATVQGGWVVGQRRARANQTSVGQLMSFPFARASLAATYLVTETFGLRATAGLQVAALRIDARNRFIAADDYGLAFVALW